MKVQRADWFTEDEVFKQALKEAKLFLGSGGMTVYANQYIAVAVAYTAMRARSMFNMAYVVDRDLDTNVPKALRERGMQVAVRLGWAEEIVYKGKKAWRRSTKVTGGLHA